MIGTRKEDAGLYKYIAESKHPAKCVKKKKKKKRNPKSIMHQRFKRICPKREKRIVISCFHLVSFPCQLLLSIQLRGNRMTGGFQRLFGLAAGLRMAIDCSSIVIPPPPPQDHKGNGGDDEQTAHSVTHSDACFGACREPARTRSDGQRRPSVCSSYFVCGIRGIPEIQTETVIEGDGQVRGNGVACASRQVEIGPYRVHLDGHRSDDAAIALG
jgi:hypothetical protein